MTESRFKVTYSVCDGYVGKERPLYFHISIGELNEDMTDEDLSELFEQSMLDHFEQNVFPESSDENAFMEWARQQVNLLNLEYASAEELERDIVSEKTYRKIASHDNWDDEPTNFSQARMRYL